MGSYKDSESNHLESYSGGFERYLAIKSVEGNDRRMRLLCIRVIVILTIWSLMKLSFRGLKRSLEG